MYSKRPRNLDDTQDMPPLADERIQPPFPQRSGGSVRELPPDNFASAQREIFQPEPPRVNGSGKRKILLLAAGFVLALLLGFVLAGYSQDQHAAKEAERARQEQQFLTREQRLSDQEASLKEERRRLEEQKRALEAKQKEIEKESSRLKGKSEQIKEDSKNGGLGQILDKVTGKEKERQQAKQANEQQSEKLESETAEVHRSIEEAQRMLEEVDNRIDDIEAMQQEAQKLRGQFETAYAENKDTIDQVIYYMGQGADMLRRLFISN